MSFQENDLNQQIEQVETTIEHGKEMARKAQLVRRLSQNKDFQEIVEKGYFEEEAVRLTHLLSDPRVDEKTRSDVERDLMSIGGLRRYLSVTVIMGDSAADELMSHEETLDYLRSDEAQEDYQSKNGDDA